MRFPPLTIVFACTALMLAASTSAAGPNVPWSTKDMKTAIRAIAYPKPHPKKLACKGSGATTSGEFASFRCVATYRHHRHHRFSIEGQGEGGWLCAGKTLATCQLLRRGFLTSQAVNIQGMGPSVDLAARGYMANKYGAYQAKGFCKQTTSSTWTCQFVEATVTLTVKAARGGYVEVATT